MTKKRNTVNVGIDVGKAQLDVCLLERDLMIQMPNEGDAIRALVSRLARFNLARIVIEATGRLEQPFVRAALAKGLPVVVVSPLKVRRYAGAIGLFAKTDAIDTRKMLELLQLRHHVSVAKEVLQEVTPVNDKLKRLTRRSKHGEKSHRKPIQAC